MWHLKKFKSALPEEQQNLSGYHPNIIPMAEKIRENNASLKKKLEKLIFLYPGSLYSMSLILYIINKDTAVHG